MLLTVMRNGFSFLFFFLVMFCFSTFQEQGNRKKSEKEKKGKKRSTIVEQTKANCKKRIMTIVLRRRNEFVVDVILPYLKYVIYVCIRRRGMMIWRKLKD